jgi:hypothetical protein
MDVHSSEAREEGRKVRRVVRRRNLIMMVETMSGCSRDVNGDECLVVLAG